MIFPNFTSMEKDKEKDRKERREERQRQKELGAPRATGLKRGRANRRGKLKRVGGPTPGTRRVPRKADRDKERDKSPYTRVDHSVNEAGKKETIYRGSSEYYKPKKKKR